MFSNIMPDMERISENSSKIFKLKEDYIYTIDSVIQFLQGKKSKFGIPNL
jgi:hypothetical protein